MFYNSSNMILNLLPNILFCAQTSYLSHNLFCFFDGLDKQTNIWILIFYTNNIDMAYMLSAAYRTRIPVENDRNFTGHSHPCKGVGGASCLGSSQKQC